jgi:hypothetical protein
MTDVATLVFESEKAEDTVLNIYSMDGKLVRTLKVNVTNGLNTIEIARGSLESGRYIIEIMGYHISLMIR